MNIYLIFSLDPLDPLTEIINSGQGYSLAITIERFLWVIIGLFFIGAISKSIKRSMLNNISSDKKTNFQYFKFMKNKDEEPK